MPRRRGASVLFRAPRPARPRRRRPDRSSSATTTRRCWPPSRPTPSRPRRSTRTAPAELFYTSGIDRPPEGGGAHPPRPVPARRPLARSPTASPATTCILHTIPLFHVNGWGTPHYLTGLGGVHVMLPRFDAGEVLRLVERGAGHPPVPRADDGAARCSTHPDARHRATSRRCGRSRSAARPPPPTLLAEVEDALRLRGHLRLRHDRVVAHAHPLARQARRAAVGRRGGRRPGCPILGVDVRVLDDDDVEVPWDGATTGEICARSNHVMAGYWNRPEETAAALRGGWLRTGDIAVVDARRLPHDRRPHEGPHRLRRREHRRRCEVEKALAAHPAVLEVAVVGMPDERWGEVPRAFVALRPGATRRPSRAASSWVRDRLAHFKAPKRRRRSSTSCPRAAPARSSSTPCATGCRRSEAGPHRGRAADDVRRKQHVGVEDAGGVEGAP